MANIQRGNPWSITGNGTSSASATQGSTTNVLYYVTDVSASSGASLGTMAIYGEQAGTTLKWQVAIGTGTVYVQQFESPLSMGVNAGAKIVVNGSTMTTVNLSGYSINAS